MSPICPRIGVDCPPHGRAESCRRPSCVWSGAGGAIIVRLPGGTTWDVSGLSTLCVQCDAVVGALGVASVHTRSIRDLAAKPHRTGGIQGSRVSGARSAGRRPKAEGRRPDLDGRDADATILASPAGIAQDVGLATRSVQRGGAQGSRRRFATGFAGPTSRRLPAAATRSPRRRARGRSLCRRSGRVRSDRFGDEGDGADGTAVRRRDISRERRLDVRWSWVSSSKRQPALSHKLEVMPSGGPLKPEEIETWQVRAEADLGELVIRVHSQ
jgi:hypothetical protein